MRADAWRSLLLLLALPAVLLAVGFGVPASPEGHAPQGPPFQFAAGRPPIQALGAIPAGALADEVWPSFAGWFQVTVAASFRTPELAQAGAERVRELLRVSAEHYEQAAHAEARERLLDAESPAPLTPPEALRLAQSGITGLEAGVGWPGASSQAAAAPLLAGRLLLVCGLKGDFRGKQRHPLASYLRAHGAQVWTEGDPTAQPFALDLTCAARDDAHAATLAASLQGYLHDAPGSPMPPPWQAGAPSAALGVRGGCARATGSRLELGALEWVRFGPGLWALLRWLEREGCRDVRLALVERPA